jgi:TolB-like protein/DNA-binding winged helix-turn-helix (wHTH) protein/tetratricopeptide (TPR) repeat protein
MSSRFRIGDLTLDTGRCLLLCGSKPVALGPLTYQLLLTLVEAAPNVVTHDELVRSIWGGRSVSPETISQRIKLLRDALGDAPGNPRYVEAVRGQGYRLLPRVEVLPQESPAGHRPRWVVPIGAAISVAAAAAIVFWIMTAQTDAVPESTSVAVLPFADLSPARDQQYLADGIAEEILNVLSRATTLRVIARTSSFSFRGKDADVSRIAEVLGVTHILEGSVRKEGDRIRVTVRLVDASDGSRLWSESYDEGVEDILALQTDVAGSVAAALKSNLQNDVADVAARYVNAEVYDLYLRGQQKLRVNAFKEAERYFEQAIAIDPEFIPGYYSLGLAYVQQVIDVQVAMADYRDRLREVVRRGERFAPDDAGLLALSGQLARYDGEIPLAEERFATALQKDPSNSVVRQLYAIFKLDQSYPDQALALNRRSLEIDPLNTIFYVNSWASYMDLWDTKEAMAAAAHARELMLPSDPWRGMAAVTRWYLSGDLAGSKSYINAAAARLWAGDTDIDILLPLYYYFIDDLQTADALVQLVRPTVRSAPDMIAVEAYRHLARGDIHEARRLAVSSLTAPKIWGGNDNDFILVRLATDAMIESGGAQRAVDFMETLAPEYARYKSRKDIDPKKFSPAPIPVKSAFSSFPALYFADYVRALRAIGDEAGANQMLDHLEAVLALRRERGLFIEERHAAEALALRGRTEAALDALEKAERDRTIYHRWHLVLLHNEIFAGFRNHPRFLALVEKIRRDLSRQREQLESAKN